MGLSAAEIDAVRFARAIGVVRLLTLAGRGDVEAKYIVAARHIASIHRRALKGDKVAWTAVKHAWGHGGRPRDRWNHYITACLVAVAEDPTGARVNDLIDEWDLASRIGAMNETLARIDPSKSLQLPLVGRRELSDRELHLVLDVALDLAAP